jgi:hypothetical protein
VKYFRFISRRKSYQIAMLRGEMAIDKGACGAAHFASKADGGFLTEVRFSQVCLYSSC